jgi:small-conductance mechanosensitive channel
MVDDIQMAWQDLGDTLRFNDPLVRILLILALVVLIQAILHHSIDRLVERAVRHHKHANRAEEHKREATLKTFFRTSSSVALWIVAAIFILMQLHLNLSALLTSAGLIGVIAGIGGQSVIKDCLAGLFIILENQLRVDDIVSIATPTATVAGLVEEVTIRTTRLRDLDGNLHILTNGTIGVITNMSYSFAQVNVDIQVSYDTDIDLVERLIEEAGQQTASNKKLKSEILEPIKLLRVDKLGESTVTLKALGKVKPGMQWEVAGDFRRNLKKLFDQHKIAAPYNSIIVREAKK